MATTEIEICNVALRDLGATRIRSMNDETPGGELCRLHYTNHRKELLRTFPWRFAAKRTTLTANATAPAFTYDNAYDLPSDYIMLLPPDEVGSLEDLDWVVEGQQLLTNDDSPLDFRYIYDVTDVKIFDPLFSKALSMALAVTFAEPLTQSNTKIATANAKYEEVIKLARSRNAFEKTHREAPIDKWAQVRSAGRDNTRNWFIR